ncbi:LysR family transcriptional regulator [Paucibacter sp. B2R-40]|uniref:LysR family transcriptional regulator n=1 Tax=Paucibacter sp. B2R-40 TaxID=2893554 RepID=UPI0021E409FC|nr:LysR family transcriptional regulator [Paucibacter sp. B2R-40]MCV2357011.1 LysR family transcriptional regulator [Paucibacter sp. B2R-40]
MSLDADDLLLFARVVEAGSFSRAAERVHLPKSTVSRRIAALEQRLGEKLLQRSTRSLTLTEFGAGVLEHARALAAEVDGALALALHRQQRPSGRLRVSMPGDLANLALPAMLSQFVLDHPAVTLELDLSPRRVDLIAEGFDLAVRMGSLAQDSQLGARRLALLSNGLYASPAYVRSHGEPLLPEALEHLHGLMILSRSGDAMPWHLSKNTLGSAGAQGELSAQVWQGVPSSRSLVNAPDLLLKMAFAGVGVAAVGEHFAQDYVARGELLRILPDWCLPAAECWAVFPERRLMPLRTRVFLEALATALSGCSGLERESFR